MTKKERKNLIDIAANLINIQVKELTKAEENILNILEDACIVVRVGGVYKAKVESGH